MTRRSFATLLPGAYIALAAEAPPLRVRVNGRVEAVGLEDYTAAVLAGESSVFRSAEALQAMAVAVRTYALRFRGRHASEGFDLCDTTHCQRFEPADANDRTRQAVRQTTGQVLRHRGQPALTYYTLDCGSHAEEARAVWPDQAEPYLRTHADPNCASERWHWETNGAALADALRKAGLRAPRTVERLSVATRTPSGRAATLVLSGAGEQARLSASSLRFAVGRAFGFQTLRSDLYQAGNSGGRIVFDGTGSGHGVGLCQRGADRMGLAGRTYREILAFYYPGAALDAQSWQRVAREGIVLFTQQPGTDAAVFPIATAALRAAEQRTRFKATSTVTLRVYPSAASFIEATGEPGWVAARMSADEIDLQPLTALRARGALEATMRHELLHWLVESHTRARLPTWFREGLVEYLSGDGPHAASGRATDKDLRQSANEGRARAAYAAARDEVAALMRGYGETTVLGWLSTGLPREVRNATARQPATNNK